MITLFPSLGTSKTGDKEHLQILNWIAKTENTAQKKKKQKAKKTNKNQFFFSTWSIRYKVLFVQKYIKPVTQKQFNWLNKKGWSDCTRNAMPIVWEDGIGGGGWFILGCGWGASVFCCLTFSVPLF